MRTYKNIFKMKLKKNNPNLKHLQEKFHKKKRLNKKKKKNKQKVKKREKFLINLKNQTIQ